ncbi:MAG: histidinol-phosphate transaminase [Thaumarchaeota archaeon]|nr:histidinol-phosphate transaminase [Nitrososphaerota archaeon]
MKTRRLLEGFEAYGWETPTREIAAKAGLKPEQVVRLDTNASQYRPSAAMKELARLLPKTSVNDYPDTSYHGLAEGLSRYTGKAPERIVVTNGADEGLDIVTKVFIDKDDEVVIPTPTYSMYGIGARLMGARVRTVPRKANFELDVEKMLEAVGPRTRLVFLCNPNNPTGNFSPLAEVERIAKESGVAVLVDEAYFEMSGKTAIDFTDSYENVIVCRTMSKAFSMAGVRVGYLVAKEETVTEMNKVRPPNSLSVLSVILGEAGLANLGEMRKNVRATVRERQRLYERLLDMKESLLTFPSETNFILFKPKHAGADRVHQRLMERGLVLRNLSHVRGVENCLRTTVGTPQTNRRLLVEMKRALEN